MANILHNNHPEAVLEMRSAQLLSSLNSDDLFAVAFSYQQYYLPDSPEIQLLAFYQVNQIDGRLVVHCGVMEQPLDFTETDIRGTAYSDLVAIAEHWRFPLFNLAESVRLETISIDKPWGKEIWYTGIESRGQSRASDGNYSSPLPWVLVLAPKQLVANRQRKINLLKILDPLAEEVYGDLYFELHEEKREVYVVTHVDQQAWPDGVGSIRFGFDQQLRAEYDSDASFRDAYLDAVKAYEAVRREIDGQVDLLRQQQAIPLDAPVSAEQLKQWHQQLPKEVRQREGNLRRAMNQYTALLPLRLGDVVKVPCLTPHALQHGVRTVEFQTPVYERKILSFAQKVLTQGHWDTDEAVSLMSTEPEVVPPLQVLEEGAGFKLEEIVQFDDFLVQRLTLSSQANWSLPSTAQYALLMCVSGELIFSENSSLLPEQAVLVPAERSEMTLANTGVTKAVLLLAFPL